MKGSQYEIPHSSQSKDMASVKVFAGKKKKKTRTHGQTDGPKTVYPRSITPDLSGTYKKSMVRIGNIMVRNGYGTKHP